MRKTILLLTLASALISYAHTQKDIDDAETNFLNKKYDLSFKQYTSLSSLDIPQFYELLGNHYEYALGTEKNLRKAYEYYRMAADRGSLEAQAEMAYDLYDEDGNFDSDQDKIDLYRYARMYNTNLVLNSTSNSVYDAAQFALYMCYKNGWGVQQNTTLATIWLCNAVSNECSEAEEEYATLLGIDDDEIGEEAFYEGAHNLLIKTLRPYIPDNLDGKIITLYFDLLDGDVSAVKRLGPIYENPRLPVAGKAFIFGLISPLVSYFPDLLSPYAPDASKYASVSLEDKTEWLHETLTKVLWAVDTKLATPKSKISAPGYVDLGLPSGTIWAENNFTNKDYQWNAATPSAGALVASVDDWRELLNYCDIVPDFKNHAVRVVSPNGNSISFDMDKDDDDPVALFWTKNNYDPYFDLDPAKAICLGIIMKKSDFAFRPADKDIDMAVRTVKKYPGYK